MVRHHLRNPGDQRLSPDLRSQRLFGGLARRAASARRVFAALYWRNGKHHEGAFGKAAIGRGVRGAAVMTEAVASQPLAGCRVLELGSTVAGPFCGKLLGDFGADV